MDAIGIFRNFCGTAADCQTADRKRLDALFKGVVTPFEARVVYKPINPKDEARCHFGNGMFKGFSLNVVRRMAW